MGLAKDSRISGKTVRLDYDSGSHWGLLVRLPGRANPGRDWAVRLDIALQKNHRLKISLVDPKGQRVPVGMLKGSGRWDRVTLDLDSETGLPAQVAGIELQIPGGQGLGWFELRSVDFVF